MGRFLVACLKTYNLKNYINSKTVAMKYERPVMTPVKYGFF